MKISPTVPININTLFLRNLETILISRGMMCSCDLDKFRKVISVEILDLLASYSCDYDNQTCDNLISQYMDDSNAVRKYVEYLSINTDNFHY
jgi:hypothetical protein